MRGLPVTQAVLDGEALWMGDDGPGSFQQTVSQIAQGDNSPGAPPDPQGAPVQADVPRRDPDDAHDGVEGR